MLGWESTYVYHELNIERGRIYVNNENIKQAIGIKLAFSEIKLKKEHL